MALNLNNIVLAGRITADVELKTTTSGKSVCSFTIAVARDKENTDFIPCVAWGTTAEFVSKYFRKGSAICIRGELRSRSYEDRNGQKRTAYEVLAERAMFVESKAEKTEQTETYEQIPVDDDSLPF